MTKKLQDIIFDFFDFTGIDKYSFSNELICASEQLLKTAKPSDYSKTELDKLIIFSIKKKLRLEESSFKILVDTCAKHKVYFNAVEKRKLLNAFCRSDLNLIHKILNQTGLSKEDFNLIFSSITLLTDIETIEYFKQEVDKPINRRTKTIDMSLRGPMIGAVFSCYFYYLFREEFVHQFNTKEKREEYISDFWHYLNRKNNGEYHRGQSLTYISLNHKRFKSDNYCEVRNNVLELVKRVYEGSDNHSYMFIYIPSDIDYKWEIAADITLFSEKYDEKELQIGYFNPEKIKRETLNYIGVNAEQINFDKVAEGFLYKDTFCLYEGSKQDSPSLLLSFRKDCRDENVIPCPACRSLNIQGNSYPTLGIKSWECKNPICPDKSMSNRGKRYSFESLLKQQSIECEKSQISKDLILRWKRDVVFNTDQDDILEYIIKCYSLPNDTVHLYYSEPKELYGRTKRIHKRFVESKVSHWEDFVESDFVKRLTIKSDKVLTPQPIRHKLNDSIVIYEGDSELNLSSIESNSIDGAVTSPPYYNAREYTQYPNMYCYVHKMQGVASEVFRCLKPGSVFLFNIFDYFDNENIVALSAMGKKRMILSSYIIFAFRNIGFRLVTNVPWDKGEIEGKRAFNAGNNSPFYQSPLNCWEHILVFMKPGKASYDWPIILKCKPVFKMINGTNKYGHTAPFPPRIPDLLTSQLPKGSVVIDPFAGSGTTSLSCSNHSLRSIMFEFNSEYIKLMKHKLIEFDVDESCVS